jgi:hypothetical protein
MTNAILIPFDNDLPIREVTFDGLDDMYKLIGCTDVERLATQKVTFWLDGEGLLRSDAGERINARAMQLYAELCDMTLADFAVPLVGDYLLDGPCDDEGEETDVPSWVKHYPFSWSATASRSTFNG